MWRKVVAIWNEGIHKILLAVIPLLLAFNTNFLVWRPSTSLWNHTEKRLRNRLSSCFVLDFLQKSNWTLGDPPIFKIYVVVCAVGLKSSASFITTASHRGLLPGWEWVVGGPNFTVWRVGLLGSVL